MSPILFALNTIKNEIPKPILERAFMPRDQYQLRRNAFMPSTIDNEIIDKVINQRVRMDIDSIGSTEVVISLQGLPTEIVGPDKYLIHIPKDHTGGRDIVSAIALIFYDITNVALTSGGGAMTAGMLMNNGGCTNHLLKDVAAMGRSVMPLAATQTTSVKLVGDNTILVEDIVAPTSQAALRCIVTHDREFSNLPGPALRYFATLCEYACKQYIYNTLIIEIDQAELSGGRELGVIKSIVEDYREAGQLYKEYFTDKWQKVQFFADQTRNHRHIRRLMGRNF
nr:MAG TPA: Putative virion structural protein [Caudoviricetes sp.]